MCPWLKPASVSSRGILKILLQSSSYLEAKGLLSYPVPVTHRLRSATGEEEVGVQPPGRSSSCLAKGNSPGKGEAVNCYEPRVTTGGKLYTSQ